MLGTCSEHLKNSNGPSGRARAELGSSLGKLGLPTCGAASPTIRQHGFTNSCVALAIAREGSRCSVSAFADPRCMIARDQQAETTMIDLEVPVEGVALDALDAFLSSDRSPPNSAALIFDSGRRVIAKTPLDDPRLPRPRPSPVAPRIVRGEHGLARRLAKEDRHLSVAVRRSRYPRRPARLFNPFEDPEFLETTGLARISHTGF